MRSIHRRRVPARLLVTLLVSTPVVVGAAAGPPGVPAVASTSSPRDAGLAIRWSSLPATLHSSHAPTLLARRFEGSNVDFARHADWLVVTGDQAGTQRFQAWHEDEMARAGGTVAIRCTLQRIPADFDGELEGGRLLTGDAAVAFIALTNTDPASILDRQDLALTIGEPTTWPSVGPEGPVLTGTLAAKSDETERTGVDVELEFSRERTIGRRTDRTGHRFTTESLQSNAALPIVLLSTPFSEASVRTIDGSRRTIPVVDGQPGDLLALVFVPLAESPPTGETGGLYRPGEATRDGIGRYFFDREIAQVMGHFGAGWLERETRQREERTDVLLNHLDIRAGSSIADIGAGSGYYTRRLAALTGPDGTVLATDIQPEMLDILEKRLREEGIENVEPRLGAVDDCGLAPMSVDLILLVDVYHEFDHPWEMLRSMRRALRPNGRIALVEYRANDPRVPIKPLHTMTSAQSRLEFEAAGFELLEETEDGLPWQRVQFFGVAPAGSAR